MYEDSLYLLAGAGGQNMDIHTNIHPCLEGFQRARDLPRRGRDSPPGRGQQEAQHRRRRRQPGRSPFKVGYLFLSSLLGRISSEEGKGMSWLWGRISSREKGRKCWGRKSSCRELYTPLFDQLTW